MADRRKLMETLQALGNGCGTLIVGCGLLRVTEGAGLECSAFWLFRGSDRLT